MPEVAIYVGAVLVVFLLRIVGTAVGTVRILMTNRGNELWSGILGFFEILIYVIGMGVVVNDLTNIGMLMSYCLGFSVGTIVGMRIEQRMALGFVNLRAISRSRASTIADALRRAGFGATLSHGEGRDGTVGVITATVPRKHSRKAMNLIHGLDPDAFMVADEARAVSRGWVPSAISIFPLPPSGPQNVEVESATAPDNATVNGEPTEVWPEGTPAPSAASRSSASA